MADTKCAYINISNIYLGEVRTFLDKKHIEYSYVKDPFEFAEGEPNWIYLGKEKHFIEFVQMKLPDEKLIPEIIDVIASAPPRRKTGFAYKGYTPED